MSPDEEILICAVRYALGRMSYVVNIVCEYVCFRRKKLSTHCKNIIIRDIEETLARYHDIGRTVGWEYDEREWLRLLEALKND